MLALEVDEQVVGAGLLAIEMLQLVCMVNEEYAYERLFVGVVCC